MWAPGPVPKPAEVNENIPLDLPDPWMQTECMAAQLAWHNPNAGFFC